jgi:hypothetical protein
MVKASLRAASIFCLAIWAAIWLLFVLMRFSTLDIRGFPGISSAMLIALGVVLLAPLMATGLAGAAVVRQPRAALNWLTLACAAAVLFGQVLVFLISGWQ